MLSYQHGYHAGNFADIIKHFTLSRLINYLTIKEKPLFYLETHAGRGLYDLKSSQAKKTGEYEEGIGPLWEKRKQLSPVFDPFLNTIKKYNKPNELRFYPGSPALAIEGLRHSDRLICCELHPTEFKYLSNLPHTDKKVSFVQENGMQQLIALLPPKEKRGLIFIDPSYEIKQEYKEIPQLLKQALHRFATGTYCLWYPIIEQRFHKQLRRGLKDIAATKTLIVEFFPNNIATPGMVGCGLWICNPPFTLAEELKIALNEICKVINPGNSSYTLESLSN